MGNMNPDQPHWKIFTAISGIYLKSRKLAEESLKPLNVTWPQFGALMTLNIQENINQRELAERLESDTTTAMVICDSLQKKGWINRVKDPNDRRVNRLILTESGKKVFTEAYPLMLARYDVFLKSISEERIMAVLPVLEELYGTIKKHYDKEIT